MAALDSQSDFQVLVIGAGSIGLPTAQRLKMLGIECTVLEREQYLNERPRDWSFGIYWGAELADRVPADFPPQQIEHCAGRPVAASKPVQLHAPHEREDR